MKAEIDISGTLIIKAETPLEGYAIQRWVDQNWQGCAREIKTDNIQFDWNINNNGETLDKEKMRKIYFEWIKLPAAQVVPLDEFISNYKD